MPYGAYSWFAPYSGWEKGYKRWFHLYSCLGLGRCSIFSTAGWTLIHRLSTFAGASLHWNLCWWCTQPLCLLRLYMNDTFLWVAYQPAQAGSWCAELVCGLLENHDLEVSDVLALRHIFLCFLWKYSLFQAISFYITAFSVLSLSFSALSRIISSRSDGVSSAGTTFLFISGSLGGLPFRCAANPPYPFLYRLTHWYNSPLLIPAHIAVSFMDAPANTFATNSYFWSGVHSLFCSSYVILLDHTHLPCEPTHESYPETSFPLHRAVFQATAHVDIGRHTSVCIHSCTSWKYPQYWMSSIGGTYQKFTDLYFLDESCVTAVARCSD